jgi:glycosyltransferase involved in cell wall biosynthesis
LLLAAADRSDVVVIDEHLSRPDQMAMHAAADCLVSLHRSEGLGLHCAEAMWLGKPVIATRYSGNLDFMDDGNSLLVDASMVPVLHGEGVYPPTARWADPDLDQAAAHMRAIVADADLRTRLGLAARERMRQQPALATTGGLMRALAGLAYEPRPTKRSRT